MKRVASVLLLILCGCGPFFDDFTFTTENNAGTISQDGATLVEGKALRFTIRPNARGAENYREWHIPTLSSDDDFVARVIPMIEINTYLLTGERPGTTHLRAKVKGGPEVSIPVLVEESTP